MDRRPYPESHFETLCAEIEAQPASVTRPLVMPIVPAAVFQIDSLETLDDLYEGRAEGYIYSRDGNPNQTVLERLVAGLEGAEAGLACASGMGAIATALMTGLKAGDRIVAGDALYGRTTGLINGPFAAFGIRSTFADLTDEAAAAQALSEPAAAVIVETISNPLLTIPDLPSLARLAHAAGARLIVDSTFATPFHCRPILHGADIVVHSGTKYFGGHSDVTNGILAGPAEFVKRARQIMATFGSPASPFDCWLTVRGIKTLALRMERASANAQKVAEYLAGRTDFIAAVHYPGLPTHPQHERAVPLLQHGFGAMVAFELRGGEEAASAFVRALQRIRLAPSLADVSTTISHPSKTSHRGMTEEARQAAGIRPGLIRLSVGIEHVDDIIAD
ncbi:MAG: trans-sulfuration enzyme family protein, partial [Dehalococcoidia bacterium]